MRILSPASAGAAMHRRLVGQALWMFLLGAVVSVASSKEGVQRLQVDDLYLELHTGPGRGYPVFHVVERGRWIEILKRKTDWFLVGTEKDKKGWVQRVQLERTLTGGGVKKSFRDVLLDDFLQRRVETGFAGGVFDGEPSVSARVGYRFTKNVMLEAAVMKASGKYSSSTLYYANIVSMPFPGWRISPFMTLGIGRFHNAPDPTLVDDQKTDSTTPIAGAGVRGYLTRNFVLRFDFKNYLALIDDNQDEDFKEYSLGLSFFF